MRALQRTQSLTSKDIRGPQQRMHCRQGAGLRACALVLRHGPALPLAYLEQRGGQWSQQVSIGLVRPFQRCGQRVLVWSAGIEYALPLTQLSPLEGQRLLSCFARLQVIASICQESISWGTCECHRESRTARL